MPALGPPWCARCGAPTVWPVERCSECAGRRLAFDSAFAAIPYTGPGRAVVRAWKEHGLRLIVREAAALVTERVPAPAADVITYIPADGDRSLRRGHHPPLDLARALGAQWGLPVADLVGRARPVARQTGLSRPARRLNLDGAFIARCRPVPARVALVDDVFTTGATASAAAAALRAAGAAQVRVVTFARAVRLPGGRSR